MSAKVVSIHGVAQPRVVQASDDVSDLRPGDMLRAAPDAIDDGSNIRHRLPDMEQMEASVRASGVLLPVLVTVTLTGLVLVDGHRRLAAARAVGRASVPVVVVSQQEAGDLRMTQMELNENARGLTGSERAEQLVLLASTPGAWGRLKALGASKEEVQHAKAVRGSAAEPVLRPALDEGALDLVTAARVADLAADPDWHGNVEEMVAEIKESGAAAFVLRREQSAAERARSVRQEVERLRAEGEHAVAMSEIEARAPGWRQRWAWTDRLEGADGGPMSNEEHADCEHRIVLVWDAHLSEEVLSDECCMDPKAAGHRLRNAHPDDERLTHEQALEMAEERQRALAERAAQVRRRAALAAATEVRQQWLRQRLQASEPLPSSVWSWAVDTLAGVRGLAGHLSVTMTYSQELASTSTWRRWLRSAKYADRIVIALACACAEQALDTGETVEAGPYLSMLGGLGHELSDVEQEQVSQWEAESSETVDGGDAA